MKKILIIEDDPDILDVLQVVFTTELYEPVVSRQAIPVGMIKNISPDIILLDHWLGDKSGSDLCIEIKADPALSKIPVILVSSHPYLSDVAAESCADGFFPKPFDIIDLYNYIRKFG